VTVARRAPPRVLCPAHTRTHRLLHTRRLPCCHFLAGGTPCACPTYHPPSHLGDGVGLLQHLSGHPVVLACRLDSGGIQPVASQLLSCPASRQRTFMTDHYSAGLLSPCPTTTCFPPGTTPRRWQEPCLLDCGDRPLGNETARTASPAAPAHRLAGIENISRRRRRGIRSCFCHTVWTHSMGWRSA